MAKVTYDSVLWDSLSEAMVYCWLKEAKELGVIVDFTTQQQYPLTGKVTYQAEKQLKTKTKVVTKTLLQASHYTSDFEVEVRIGKELPPLLKPVSCLGGHYEAPYVRYTIDVKGARSPVTQVAKFSLTQKFLWHIHGVYVNKVVPEKFFQVAGLPSVLPPECYKKSKPGELYANFQRAFKGAPTIAEVWL